MFETDPLLKGRDYDNIERLMHENEAVQRQIKAFGQNAANRSQTPIWDEIDRIVSSLSSQEAAYLNSSDEFMENSTAIQELVNAEILAIVRARIEQSDEGHAILERQLAFVKKASRAAKEQQAQRDALLNEYMTQYSDMTFNEFMEMKNGKRPKKQQKQ